MAIVTTLAMGLARDVINGLGSSKATAAANAISDSNATSLVEYSESARVEPIVVVDTRLTGYDSTSDVMKMLHSRFSGYYLSAASLVGDVGRIKTIKALDKINPSRNTSFNIANSIILNSRGRPSTESINEDLDGDDESLSIPLAPPQIDFKNPESTRLPVYSAESSTLNDIKESIDRNIDRNSRRENLDVGTISGTSTKAAGDLRDAANLSIGQMITMTISDGESKRDINVSIQLVAYPTDPRTLRSILEWSDKDNSFKNRFSAWRAGELAFWRDLVFMRDIYVERTRALIKDKSGIFKALTSRVNKNMIAGLVSMTPSVGTISSIAVISQETLEEAEENMDRTFEDFQARQRFMNSTGIMILAVVDNFSQVVTVYTYTRPRAEEFSLKDIKTASKNAGGDITEIIKLLNPNSRF